eukprot:CAMPEP_0194284762 /NCGR_PEP_ID=MMETSP0169-20130528/28508_1 /TAXON_ID=218684 /ORGANISM="Corethron pennatum, Strain L29A3" /LENGTH=48 /DNA_ID= /DNA_START= /DNA_END= /DNA_ORIENTATION=
MFSPRPAPAPAASSAAPAPIRIPDHAELFPFLSLRDAIGAHQRRIGSP